MFGSLVLCHPPPLQTFVLIVRDVGKEAEQHFQVLCSAFLMLLLINSNKTITTHVTNNNLTVQASHITVMQEMDGLKSALVQCAFAWEENMKVVQSLHYHQCETINALEA